MALMQRQTQARYTNSDARLAALETQVQTTVSDVNRLTVIAEKLTESVSSVSATAQVLVAADGSIAGRVSALESANRDWIADRLRIEARFAQIELGTARDTRDIERRAETRDESKTTTEKQNNLAVTLALGSMGSSLLFIVINLIIQLVLKH